MPTLTPQALPAVAIVPNPMAGGHAFLEADSRQPEPQAELDGTTVYRRRDDMLGMSSVWPGIDQPFNWTWVEQLLTANKQRGQRTALRFRTMKDGRSFVPAGVPTSNGWPKWGDSRTLAVFAHFWEQLADRYDGDERLAYIEAGLLGSTSEWADWGDGGTPGDAMLARYADVAAKPFTQSWICFPGHCDDQLWDAALRHPRAGLMVDSVGHWVNPNLNRDTWAQTQIQRLPESIRTELLDRTRRLCVGEHMTYTDERQGLKRWPQGWQQGLEDAQYLKMTAIRTTQFGYVWGELSPYRDAILATMRACGARLRLAELSCGELRAGAPVQLDWHWVNEGAAPPFDALTATLRLRDRTGTVVWSAASASSLQFVGEVLSTDRFSGANAAPPEGTYQAEVLVRPPISWLPPWRLAQVGRQPDGAYVLGEITVGTGDTAPPPPPGPDDIPMRLTALEIAVVQLAQQQAATTAKTNALQEELNTFKQGLAALV